MTKKKSDAKKINLDIHNMMGNSPTDTPIPTQCNEEPSSYYIDLEDHERIYLNPDLPPMLAVNIQRAHIKKKPLPPRQKVSVGNTIQWQDNYTDDAYLASLEEWQGQMGMAIISGMVTMGVLLTSTQAMQAEAMRCQMEEMEIDTYGSPQVIYLELVLGISADDYSVISTALTELITPSEEEIQNEGED